MLKTHAPARRRLLMVLLAASLSAAGQTAIAQAAWPTRPIKLIATAPAGGAADYVARLIATGLSTELGQPVTVDNRGGASGNLGTDLVAKAPADGYTILLTDGAALAINSSVRKDLPFNVQRDLAPISLVATMPTLLTANPDFPVSNLKDLVSYARKNAATTSYASPGVGTPHHLAAALFSKEANLQIVHIPYKGGGPMVADVLSGQVPLLFTGLQPQLPHIRAGKLKPIAISSRQRSPLLPDVPTFIESGYPDFEAAVFFTVYAPAQVPPQIASALSTAVSKILATPDIRKKLEEQALTVVNGSPEQLRNHFNRESAKWGELIRTTGIVLE